MAKAIEIGENDASILDLLVVLSGVFPSFQFIHLFFLNAVFVEFYG